MRYGPSMDNAQGFNGAAARAIREEAGVTMADLARRLGITRGHLNNLETGFRQPSFAVASAIARELDVPLDRLNGSLAATT